MKTVNLGKDAFSLVRFGTSDRDVTEWGHQSNLVLFSRQRTYAGKGRPGGPHLKKCYRTLLFVRALLPVVVPLPLHLWQPLSPLSRRAKIVFQVPVEANIDSESLEDRGSTSESAAVSLREFEVVLFKRNHHHSTPFLSRNRCHHHLIKIQRAVKTLRLNSCLIAVWIATKEKSALADLDRASSRKKCELKREIATAVGPLSIIIVTEEDQHRTSTKGDLHLEVPPLCRSQTHDHHHFGHPG